MTQSLLKCSIMASVKLDESQMLSSLICVFFLNHLDKLLAWIERVIEIEVESVFDDQ